MPFSDIIVICIADDFGSSVKTAALLKKLGIEKIYGRESSLIHNTVLNAVGVCNTINPEYDTAVVFAEKLIMTGVWSIYSISDDIKIAEISVPEEYAGRKLSELDVSGPDNIAILAVKYIDTKLSKPSLEKWIAVDPADPSQKGIYYQ